MHQRTTNQCTTTHCMSDRTLHSYCYLHESLDMPALRLPQPRLSTHAHALTSAQVALQLPLRAAHVPFLALASRARKDIHTAVQIACHPPVCRSPCSSACGRPTNSPLSSPMAARASRSPCSAATSASSCGLVHLGGEGRGGEGRGSEPRRLAQGLALGREGRVEHVGELRSWSPVTGAGMGQVQRSQRAGSFFALQRFRRMQGTGTPAAGPPVVLGGAVGLREDDLLREAAHLVVGVVRLLVPGGRRGIGGGARGAETCGAACRCESQAIGHVLLVCTRLGTLRVCPRVRACALGTHSKVLLSSLKQKGLQLHVYYS